MPAIQYLCRIKSTASNFLLQRNSQHCEAPREERISNILAGWDALIGRWLCSRGAEVYLCAAPPKRSNANRVRITNRWELFAFIDTSINHCTRLLYDGKSDGTIFGQELDCHDTISTTINKPTNNYTFGILEWDYIWLTNNKSNMKIRNAPFSQKKTTYLVKF